MTIFQLAFVEELERQRAEQERKKFGPYGYGGDEWEYECVDASVRSLKMEEEQGGGKFQRLGLGPKPWDGPRPPQKT